MCFSHYWNHIAQSALVQGGWLCPKSLFLRKVSGAKPLGQPVGQMDCDYRNLSRMSLQKLQSCQESSVHLSRVLSQLPFCRCLPFSCWDLLHPSCSVSLLCRQTICSRCSPLWCGWQLTSLLKSSFLCVKFDDLITLLRYEMEHLFFFFFVTFLMAGMWNFKIFSGTLSSETCLWVFQWPILLKLCGICTCVCFSWSAFKVPWMCC